METALRSALIQHLQDDPLLTSELNAITEEAPLRASFPWVGIVASASTDWSMKTTQGREIRLALELHCRGDDPDTAAALVQALEKRVESLPADHTLFTLASVQFLRARAEQRPRNIRAVLLEYRFRLHAPLI
ncbi:DUF3168 domain-containing protein [Altererythrobacter indicus]|uniref:DUF3168 domain-containing protein n=1 Tax=Altericroceibacterium indicum TaxID=374177 RepID=A0A845AD19_9SPHN|nr:DUF3168 domain-containing protein [Altericroceibacterium indicum]MXP26881.1 DUF3168 domain-containing protein [Altericroceibacterium indicum]